MNPELLKVLKCPICKGLLAASMVRPWRGYPTKEQQEKAKIEENQYFQKYKETHLQHLKEHGLIHFEESITVIPGGTHAQRQSR